MKWQVTCNDVSAKIQSRRKRVNVDGSALHGKVNECKSFIRLCFVWSWSTLSVFLSVSLCIFLFLFPPALRRTSVALFLSPLRFCYETISVSYFFFHNFGPLVNIGHCSTLALLFLLYTHTPPYRMFIQIHLSFMLSYLLMYNCWFIELKTYLISNVID